MQFQGYVNRFGPGLVIYWGGFVAEIRAWTPPDVLIASRLPEEWVLPGDAAVRTCSSGNSGGGGGCRSSSRGEKAAEDESRAGAAASGAAAPNEGSAGAERPCCEEETRARAVASAAGIEYDSIRQRGALSPAALVLMYASVGLLDKLKV